MATSPNRSQPPGLGDYRAELAAAARFLTRLGFLGQAEAAPIELSRTVWAFPIVGAAVGALGGAVLYLASGLGVPAFVAAVLGVGATVALTGALHEDGLADVADGFGGGADRARKLEIMRDSRIGAYGVLALALVMVAKIGALGAFRNPGDAWLALIAASAMSRAAMPILMVALPPARAEGLGAMAGRPERTRLLAALGIALALALVLLDFDAALAAAAGVGVVAYLMTGLARRQIQGHTGDVLGATQQIADLTVLVTLSAAMA